MSPFNGLIIIGLATSLVSAAGVRGATAAQVGCGAERLPDESARAPRLRECFATPVLPALRQAGILRGAAIGPCDFVLTLTAVTGASLASATSGDTSGRSLPPELRRHQEFISQNQTAVAPLARASGSEGAPS